jgi:hypothetical protein
MSGFTFHGLFMERRPMLSIARLGLTLGVMFLVLGVVVATAGVSWAALHLQPATSLALVQYNVASGPSVERFQSLSLILVLGGLTTISLSAYSSLRK